MFRRKRSQADFAEELQAHLILEAVRLQEAGMSKDEAQAAARRNLGKVTRVQERFYEARRWLWLDDLIHDLRYGLRQLQRGPGFTALAVLTLALGIGANTAIFTLINDVMLKVLPVKSPQQLVLLNWAARAQPLGVYHWFDGERWKESGLVVSRNFSYRTFDQMLGRNQVFSNIFAFKQFGLVNVGIKGESGLTDGQLVSGGYFSGVGVSPVIGRTITDADDRQGAPPVAVISYGF